MVVHLEDLRIKDLTVQDPVIEVHPNIPTIPFNLCMYAKSNGGKTNVLLNLLQHYKAYFKDRMIVFTKSRNGSLYSLENSMGALLFNSLDNSNGENLVERLLEHQRLRKQNKEKLKNYLIVF